MSPNTAQKWTCDGCGVSASRIDGERIALPTGWASSPAGRFCLVCNRARAAEAAVDSTPEDSTRDDRAKLRRTALIEFEVRRTPDLPDSTIAKACRSSASVVAAVRKLLREREPDRPARRRPAPRGPATRR